MKSKSITLALCTTILMATISSCGTKDSPVPTFSGTYIGTSTPSTGSAYADTVIITQAGISANATVQRTFSALNHAYTFNLKGTISSANISIADTSIYFSPSPTTYSCNGSLADTVLTLHDSFTYFGGSTGTSTFVGVKHY